MNPICITTEVRFLRMMPSVNNVGNYKKLRIENLQINIYDMQIKNITQVIKNNFSLNRIIWHAL